jgi:steroid delta-isomerase-like uncharacterized protein
MATLATTKKDQNVAIVQEAFDRFLQGNIQGVIDSCANDVEWGSYENKTVPYAGTYYGKEGAGTFFKLLGASIDYTEFEPTSYHSSGDKVFARGYQKGIVKSTGKTFGHQFLMEFTLKSKKVSSFFAWVDSRDHAQAFQPNLEQLTKEMHQCFSNNELDKVLANAADDVTIDAVALNTVFNGKDGFRAFMSGYKQGFPDMRLKHTSIFSNGEQVAVELMAEGTHTGPLPVPTGEIAPTGKFASIKVSEHWVWKDGKIKSIHNYADMASLMHQLGIG